MSRPADDRARPDDGAARRPAGSCYADADAARRALQLALPMLEAARADRSVCGSGFLHLVIVDPALGPADAAFDDAVLFEHSLGDRAAWDADYAGFARAKAQLAWRLGRDGAALQHDDPQRLRRGDSLLGGAVCRDGIVVAVSGAFECWDEALAAAVAACLRAVARERRDAERGAGASSAGSG